MKEVVEKAYAKINWYLAVGGRRTDGYHDILSLMQTVSLADTVTIREETEPGIHLRCHGDIRIPAGNTNLAWIAAERCFAHIGREPAVTIELEKCIPTGAGLAGGSADAAAVLRGINRIFGQPLSHNVLMKIAAEIGSDVPFCLDGGTALVHGRGECLTAVAPIRKRHLVLANAGEFVSTGEAYAQMDERQSPKPLGDCEALLSALCSSDTTIPENLLRNDFASIVLPHCPKASDALQRLRNFGGAGQMSGSGSTVYAVFQSEDAANAAAAQITEKTFCVTTV